LTLDDFDGQLQPVWSTILVTAWLLVNQYLGLYPRHNNYKQGFIVIVPVVFKHKIIA